MEEQVAAGSLPAIESVTKEYAGTICQFNTSLDRSDYDASWLRQSTGPLISWKPVVWFTFHTREEAERVVPPAAPASPEHEQQAQPVVENNDDAAEFMETPSQQPSEDSARMVSMIPSQNTGEEEEEDLLGGAGPSTQNSDAFNGAGPSHEHDPWSESQFDDLGQGQPMIYGHPMPPPLEGNNNGFDQEPDLEIPGNAPEESEEEEEEGEEGEEGNGGGEALDLDDEILDHTEGRNMLRLQLTEPLAANILLVKLINQENLMEELMDVHPYPNVDMNYIKIIGKKVVLPPGVVIKPWP